MGAEAVLPRDILITDGRVSALVEPGASGADEEIDARGLLALPGIVDAHVHFNEPGRTEWEGWEHGSRAAAAGGVTTVADMPLNSIPPTLDGAAFDAKRAAAERSSVVDFALWGGLVGEDPAPLRELAERGVVGVKAFLCDSGVPEFPALTDDLAMALDAAADAGLLVAIHAEDAELVAEATARARASGRRDPGAWAPSRPASAEARAIARACTAAGVAAARIHIVHLAAAEALGAVGVARERGVDVTVETCPHYLVFDEADALAQGAALKCAPPIRGAAERDALWSALLGGKIDLVASDHSPSSPDLKARRDIFEAWGGVNGVQSMLPAVMTEALRRAGEALDPRRVAGFIAWRLAARPAQRLGLWPRKGAIGPGCDADVALVEVGRPRRLDPADVLTRGGSTPYAGRTFDVVVRRTIVRGRTVFDDGAFPAAPGWGRLVTP